MKLKTCRSTGKRRHVSQDSAIQQVAEMKAYGRATVDEALNVYRCRTCRDWHVGHRPARLQGR